MAVSCDFNLLFLISDELEHFFLGLNHSDSAPMKSLIKFSSCFVRVISICWVICMEKKKSPPIHFYGILARSQAVCFL